MHRSPFDQLINRRQTAQDEIHLRDSQLRVNVFASEELFEQSKSRSQHLEAFAPRNSSTQRLQLPDLELVEFPIGRTRQSSDFKADQQAKSYDPIEPKDSSDIDKTKMITIESQKPESLSPSAPRPLFSPDSPLIEKTLANGALKTEQAHPDGTIRTHLKLIDGTIQEKISDRYGRPLYVCDIRKDGTWAISEMRYLDTPGKISPFLATKKVTTSDAIVTESTFDAHGKTINQLSTHGSRGRNTPTI